jgi:Ca2+-binding EF-hand superfamily protein
MTRNTLATLILLAAVPLAGTAAEGTTTTNPSATGSSSASEAPPMFKELDKNKDGKISESEAKRSADVSARFSTLDADKDKNISLTEWQTSNPAEQRGAAGVTGESRQPGDMNTPKY